MFMCRYVTRESSKDEIGGRSSDVPVGWALSLHYCCTWRGRYWWLWRVVCVNYSQR